MKNKLLYPLLAAVGAASAAAACLLHKSGTAAGEGLVTLLQIPFAAVGQGLRTLSLRGGAANVLAWALYLLLCLLPAGAALHSKRTGKWSRENWLLVLTSGLLLPVLYGMINPGLLSGWFSALLPLYAAKAACGAVIWACIIGWAVLRLLNTLPRYSTARLLRGLGGLLTVLAALAVVQVCFFEVYSLLDALEALAQANTSRSDRQLLPSRVFLCLQFAVSALPTLLLVGVLHRARGLLAAALTDRYSAGTVAAAEGMAAFCRGTVTAAVLVSVAFAIAQLAFAPVLYDLDSTVDLPLVDIALVMAALLWARWMAEGQALKEENDGFV